MYDDVLDRIDDLARQINLLRATLELVGHAHCRGCGDALPIHGLQASPPDPRFNPCQDCGCEGLTPSVATGLQAEEGE